MTAVVVVLYLAVLIAIGAASSRRSLPSAEDYFLAGRSFGTVVLFMALFGTNVTAFAMLGLPGKAYHAGISVFGFFGANAAFWGPLMLAVLGYPIWCIGKRHGYLTPAQMFSDRWASPWIGRVLVVLLIGYTLPYLVIGVIGGALALSELSGGWLSYQAAAVTIASVTVFYTSVGGMRGTAWTNVFQASVFMVFLVVAAVAVCWRLGGPTVLHERVLAEQPHLLHSHIPTAKWATAFLVGPVSIIAFPHMFIRLLTARDARALRRTVQIYPWALVLLFLPVTLLGVWGAIAVPGLVGDASDSIVPTLVATYLPPWLSAVGLAAILAAVMSSLDGQLLTMSTVLAVDVFHRSADGRRWGRAGVVTIAAAALVIALARQSIFSVSVYAFSGYTLIIPVMVCAFFWKRSTAAGVLSGTLVGHALLLLYTIPGDVLPAWLTPPAVTVFPVAVCMVVEIVIIVVVSLGTAPPSAAHTERFARPFDDE